MSFTHVRPQQLATSSWSLLIATFLFRSSECCLYSERILAKRRSSHVEKRYEMLYILLVVMGHYDQSAASLRRFLFTFQPRSAGK